MTAAFALPPSGVATVDYRTTKNTRSALIGEARCAQRDLHFCGKSTRRGIKVFNYREMAREREREKIEMRAYVCVVDETERGRG